VLPLQILGGRYRLDEVLGVGGMSVVWRATDDLLDRAVAVKILAGDLAFDVDSAAVLAEAQAAARLSHPNICTVFDYGESLQADGRIVPYVVMELLSGPSLAQRLKDGPLPSQEALRIAAEVAAGLAEAHAHGIVHRDVKPGNVILTSSGAKVIDFGIAAMAGAPNVVGSDGGIIATFTCVAPESIWGGTVLPASDMFGWGVLLFRLLTGALPWPPGTTLEDRLSAVAPLPIMPGVPGKVGDLYLSCLAEDPDDRPTATAAAAVVRVALTVRTPQPSDVVPRGGLPDDSTESVALGAIADADRRRRRRRAAVLAAGLVAVLAAGAFALSNNWGKAPKGGAPDTSVSSAGGMVGDAPSGASATGGALPGDPPIGAVPGREVIVPGAPAGPVIVTVTVAGNGPVVEPGTSFSTKGGNVVAVCDTYGPRLTSVVANPGYYPNQLSLVLAALAFFTKPAEGGNPTTTYRLTITCSSSGVPEATVTSYAGDHLATPAPPATTAAPPTTAVPAPTST
jgi:serine/threonine-protein kinase